VWDHGDGGRIVILTIKFAQNSRPLGTDIFKKKRGTDIFNIFLLQLYLQKLHLFFLEDIRTPVFIEDIRTSRWYFCRYPCHTFGLRI
jgi:hypothetical protein